LDWKKNKITGSVSIVRFTFFANFLMKKLLMVVANRDFQDLEFGNPYQIFQQQGYEIDIASGTGGSCF
jgi:hypothetical protein